ncbi:MAG: S8 family serine peptidase [Firmicutes bacterium]|nr:S8 family serine peptidase [Bacillota bacterium]
MKRGVLRAVVWIVALVMVLQGSAVFTGTVHATESTADYPNYVDNQLIVTFAEDVSQSAAKDMVAFAVSEGLLGNSIADVKSGIRMTRLKADGNVMLVETSRSLDEEAAAEEIRNNPAVEAAQPNYYYTATEGSVRGDYYNDGMWFLDYIDAPEAWALIKKQQARGKIAADRKPIVIASLDAGILQKHEALAKFTENAAGANKDSAPRSSSGTKVAGIIATMSGDSVGKMVHLLSIDVFHAERRNTVRNAATTADIIAGLDSASRHNARIVTMTFGRHGYDKALEKKIKWAADEGMLLITAAGDNGDTQPWYPSDYKQCLSCINTDKYENAYGTECTNERSGYGCRNDIAAPGTSIRTANLNGSYSNETGTACSAAVVAGTAAMVMYTDPTLSGTKVKHILQKTATDLGAPGRDIYTGYGMVNAQRAVARACGLTSVSSKVIGSKVTGTSKTLGRPSLKAKASEAGIVLRWSMVRNAETYLIYRKGGDSKEYKQIAMAAGSDVTWTDTSCVAGKKYSYKVAAGATSNDGKKLHGKSSNAASARALRTNE